MEGLGRAIGGLIGLLVVGCGIAVLALVGLLVYGPFWLRVGAGVILGVPLVLLLVAYLHDLWFDLKRRREKRREAKAEDLLASGLSVAAAAANAGISEKDLEFHASLLGVQERIAKKRAEAMAASAPAVDRSQTTLQDGRPVTDDHREIEPTTGMQKDYVVLSAEERAKGFVRPLRRSYVHVGPRVPPNLRDLTAEEQASGLGRSFAKFDPDHPGGDRPGKYWSHEEAARIGQACGTTTKMGLALSETYARDPKFYGGTFCVGCRDHFPVGADGEFVWDGTDERVGT